MKPILATTAALAFMAQPALADLETVRSAKGVGETADAFVAAAEGAGATIFARVDHTGGAEKVGMALHEAELVIFGNPNLGTPAMQDDPRAGLFLPLRVLVYADADGQTWLMYEEVEELFDDLDIDDDAEYVEKMEGALEKLTAKAAE